MKTRLSIFFALALFATVGLSQDKIPKDSAELLSKLSQFSAEERARTEKLIHDKEVQVADLLEAHLKRETKAGNLLVALALEAQIERLRQAGPKELPEPAPSPDKSESALILEFIVAKVWAHSGDEDLTFEFTDDGKGKKRLNSEQFGQKIEWQLVDGTIRVTFGPNTKFFLPDLRREELWEVSASGTKLNEYKANRSANKPE